jgi:hypothetical protein
MQYKLFQLNSFVQFVHNARHWGKNVTAINNELQARKNIGKLWIDYVVKAKLDMNPVCRSVDTTVDMNRAHRAWSNAVKDFCTTENLKNAECHFESSHTSLWPDSLQEAIRTWEANMADCRDLSATPKEQVDARLDYLMKLEQEYDILTNGHRFY